MFTLFTTVTRPARDGSHGPNEAWRENFRKPSLINTFQDTFWNQALLLSSRWTGINQLRAISSLRGAKAHTARHSTHTMAHERAQHPPALGTQGSHTLLNENPWPTEKTIKFLFCNQRWLIIESEEKGRPLKITLDISLVALQEVIQDQGVSKPPQSS